MSSKRASVAPPGPKPPTSLAPTVLIGEHVALTGTHNITIHDNTVIHPRAKLNSANGAITIGSNCIISERSSIGVLSDMEDAKGVTIENGVVIEVGAVVEASILGEGTVVEVNARIGKRAIVGKHCKIGPLCEVAEGEVVPDHTVIYGYGERRTDGTRFGHLGWQVLENKPKMIAKQIQVLKRIITPTNLAKY